MSNRKIVEETFVPRPTLEQRERASNVLALEPSPSTIDKSDALWVLLRGLERNPEVEELVAAGVSPRRIEILYPLEFAHVIHGVIDFITPQKYVALEYSEKWQGYGTYSKNVVRALPELRKPTDIATSRLMASDAYKALVNHIQACFPEEISARNAKPMALALWYSWWGMLQLEDTHLPLQLRMRKALAITMDWVLPELR